MIGVWLFRASLAMVGVAIAVGSVVDPVPARPVEERNGCRVVQVDFHAHTRFSDGFVSPIDLVDQAGRRGLDAVAVTEHNQTFPAKIARAYSRAVGGPTVIVGEEVTTREYHLLLIGNERPVDARAPILEVIDDAHRQGAVVVAAHPTLRFQSRFDDGVLSELDATEVMHPIAYQEGGGGIGRASELVDFYRRSEAEGHPLAALGNSDYHAGSILGLVRTYVCARSDGAEDIVDAVRQKKTATFALDGTGYGDPELIAAIAADPLEERRADYRYDGEGWLDRVARTLGFIGALGVVLFGGRRRTSTANTSAVE